jgi:hypothetical protein
MEKLTTITAGAREDIGTQMARGAHLSCCRPVPCMVRARFLCGIGCSRRGDESLRSREERRCGGEAGAEELREPLLGI